MSKAEKFKTLVEQQGFGASVVVSELQQPYQHLCERLLQFYRDFLIWLNDPKFAELFLGVA